MASSVPCFGSSIAYVRDKWLEYSFCSYGLQHLSFRVDPHTTIACWCKPSEVETQAERDKPAVVLIHGFATSGLWQWTHQVKRLQKNFRIFVPDLIFFGDSTTDADSRSEIFQAEMIAKVMESMKINSYSVVGTSYGGFVAFRLAHLFPKRVDKVVIANSGVCMTPEDHQQLLGRAKVEKVAELLLPQTPAAFRTLLRLSVNDYTTYLPAFVLQSIIQYFYINNRDAREELLQGIVLGTENAGPLPTLTQKVLLIWGELDGIFPLPLAYRLQQHLGEKTELVIIKRFAHCIQMENPGKFNSHVESFLLG